MYIQLRSSGLPLNRLHMDRAREFQSGALEHWAAARDVDLSRTQGSDAAQNGTAERAVGYVKMRMRILFAQAKELSGLEDDVVKTWWPMAADTAVTQQQSMAMGRKFPSAARLGSRVFTKRKGYGTGSPGDLKPKWMVATTWALQGLYLVATWCTQMRATCGSLHPFASLRIVKLKGKPRRPLWHLIYYQHDGLKERPEPWSSQVEQGCCQVRLMVQGRLCECGGCFGSHGGSNTVHL